MVDSSIYSKEMIASLSYEEIIELIRVLKDELQKKYSLDGNKIVSLLERKGELQIPAAIFNNNKLSALEGIVKFLKENKEMNFKKIAEILNRSDKTIWTTYKKSSIKMSELFTETDSKYFIPVSLFEDRKMSVLEVIVIHLKENYNLTNHKIAELLNRSDKTVWTVYNRAKKK